MKTASIHSFLQPCFRYNKRKKKRKQDLLLIIQVQVQLTQVSMLLNILSTLKGYSLLLQDNVLLRDGPIRKRDKNENGRVTYPDFITTSVRIYSYWL